MKYIDTFLNSITMYRLLMWGLALLTAVSVLAGFLGLIAYGGVTQLVSWIVLTAVCLSVNILCARLYKAPRNYESAYITAFILFFILEPSVTATGLLWLIVGGSVAILSKYLFALHNKHVFNPAAFGALTLSLLGSGTVLWWVGTSLLIIPTALLGLLVVHKIRRFDLFATFLVVSIAVACFYALVGGYSVLMILSQYALSWPLIFFGTIMLTEPATMPPTRSLRLMYAALTGALFSAQFSVGPLYASPQFALIVGNIFAYIVSPKEKLLLSLESIRTLGAGFYEFVFTSPQKLVFAAGQYLEWTVSEKGADVRGNRRYFTISSAPEDTTIRFATRMPRERPSSFKQTLLSLSPGGHIVAGALAGDFTLPTNTQKKLGFIAGGIGITPFISMLRGLVARGEKRDIVLFYAAREESEFVFTDVLKAAEAVGVRTVFVAGTFLTKESITDAAPDYGERLFYISGPNTMVEAYKRLLRTMGLAHRAIKTDYFPGL